MILSKLTSVSVDNWAVYSPKKKIKSEKIIKWVQLLNGSAAPSQGDSGRQVGYHIILVAEGNTVGDEIL